MGFTEGLANLAAPVLPRDNRLVRDQCLLADDQAPFAVVLARAGDLDDGGIYGGHGISKTISVTRNWG